MADKKMQALIKRDTFENWEKATNYIPINGVIVVIDMPNGDIQLKLGDGETLLKDLPNILEKKSETASNTPIYSDEILEFK